MRKNRDKTATQLREHILQHFTFPVDILFQDSSSLGLSKAVSLLEPTVQDTISKFATLSAAVRVLFFLQDTVGIVGRFYGNE